jgi:hypothetical protein
VRKLWAYAFLLGSVKLDGSLLLGSAHGCRSSTSRSRLVYELILVVDQEGENERRLQLFSFFFFVVVNRLGFEHCVCGTNNATWKDWDSPCNNWSGMLDDIVVSDAQGWVVVLTQDTMAILLGVAVELFVQYVCVVCKILQGVGQNRPKKVDSMLNGPNSWLSALRSLVLAFAPVASAKNKGLAGKLIIILLIPFYSQHSQFLGVWTKKHEKRCLVQERCLILGCMTRKQISVSWCFFMRTYSHTTVEVETRSLSKRSHYIIISLCCSLKNIIVS